MIITARICFPAEDAELGVAALREQGYSVLTHVFADEPSYVFVEASRDVPDITTDVYAISTSELDAVSELVEPFHGSVDDAGPPPVGHVPFEYELSKWTGKALS